MRGWAIAACVCASACGDTPPTATDGSTAGTGHVSTSDGSSPTTSTATGGVTQGTVTGTSAAGSTEAATEDESSGSSGGPPIGPGREFDLDGDGVGDTDLAIAPCPEDAASTCLVVDSEVTDVEAVALWTGDATCTATLTGPRIDVVGDYSGSALAEVYAAGCIGDGVTAPGTIAIIDVDGALIVGQTVAPSTQSGGYVDAVADPDVRRHPFLAPTYADDGTWGQLCAYRPDLGATAACGEGFSPVALAAPAPVFREVGGTLQDLDGDGWQDVNLIYHRTIHTVSVATLGTITSTTFDVAAATEPTSPAWFHSGRNYGTHSAFTSPTAAENLLIVGGAPVGTFADNLCNVSFFIAMLESAGSRSLAWSRYQGFSSTIFNTYAPQYVGNEAADVARLASVVDGCIHRFSGSRSSMDGEAVVVVNYFDMDAPVDYCLAEQFDLYQDPPWTDAKATAWYDCFGSNVGATGVWGMQTLRESDGVGLTGSQGTYVWGWADTLLPEDEVVYLVEDVSGPGRFDLAERPPSAMRVWTLEGGLWQPRGTSPVEGRPRIVTQAPRGSKGLGSSSYFAELSLEDRNGDGIDEFELEDGTWIGWDAAAGDFVVVP